MSKPQTDLERELAKEDQVIGHVMVGLGALSALYRKATGEIRRLRSDEWLKRAAEELGNDDAYEPVSKDTTEEVLAILRKHRDGLK